MNASIASKVRSSFYKLFTGETVNLIAAFITGYFYALILGPEVYGVWQTAKLFITFSVIFSLSLPFVMRRDYIWLRAEGKYEEADRISKIVFTYQAVITPLFSLGLIFYALFFVKDNLFGMCLITVGVIYSAQIVSGFGNIMAKGLNKYAVLRNASILTSIFSLLSLIVIYIYGIKALLITTVIVAFTGSLYYYFSGIVKFDFYWNFGLFKRLLLVAFPLYLQDISSTIFDSIDRLIIAKFLSFKDVGLYSLSSTFNVPLRVLISSFSIVVFTQLNEHYGKRNDSFVVRKHMNVPRDLISTFIPLFIGLAIMLMPLVVRFFLPKYEDGITSAQISLVATYFYLLTGFSANALFLVNKQKVSAVIFFIIGILNSVLCFVFLKIGYGISGVSFATLIAYLIFDLSMVVSVGKAIGNTLFQTTVQILKTLLSPFIIFGYIVLYNSYLNKQLMLFFDGSTTKSLLAGMGLLVIVFIPIGFRRVKGGLNFLR